MVKLDITSKPRGKKRMAKSESVMNKRPLAEKHRNLPTQTVVKMVFDTTFIL